MTHPAWPKHWPSPMFTTLLDWSLVDIDDDTQHGKVRLTGTPLFFTIDFDPLILETHLCYQALPSNEEWDGEDDQSSSCAVSIWGRESSVGKVFKSAPEAIEWIMYSLVFEPGSFDDLRTFLEQTLPIE